MPTVETTPPTLTKQRNPRRQVRFAALDHARAPSPPLPTLAQLHAVAEDAASRPEDLTRLLKAGIIDAPLAKDCLQNTALHKCARQGRVGHVRALLQTRLSSVGRGNFLGHTPLLLAAVNAHLQCVQLLLGHQQRLTAKCGLGLTVVDHVELAAEADFLRPQRFTEVRLALFKKGHRATPPPEWLIFREP